mgnify:CR=1 FL=1
MTFANWKIFVAKSAIQLAAKFVYRKEQNTVVIRNRLGKMDREKGLVI